MLSRRASGRSTLKSRFSDKICAKSQSLYDVTAHCGWPEVLDDNFRLRRIASEDGDGDEFPDVDDDYV